MDTQFFGTFGVYRFLLASLVIVSHCAPEAYGYLGKYAVFAFFILSGYVVSFILHHHYLAKKNGLIKYALNRLLRIYPAYIAVFAIAVCLIIVFPLQAREVHFMHGYPESMELWLKNISTFGMAKLLRGMQSEQVVIPVSWSLSVEILYWALLPLLIINKSVRRVVIGFTLVYTGVIILGITVNDPLLFNLGYISPLAGALPFCLGLYIFWFRFNPQFILRHHTRQWIIPLVFLITLYAAYALPEQWFYGLYISLILNSLIILYLSQVDRDLLSARARDLDDWLGDLTYPMYLVHLPVAIIIHVAVPDISLRSTEFFILVLLASVMASLLVHRWIEIPVNRVRDRIKHL